MAIYDLYGSLSDDIGLAKTTLIKALGVEMEAHESSYQGEYFQWGETVGEHYVLKRNEDPIDGEPAEAEFPKHKILLYINDTARSEDLYEQIKSTNIFVLLRHEDLD